MFRRPAPRQCHGRAARASPLPDDALQSSRSQMRLRLHHRGSLASRAVRLGLSLALFLSLAASLASAEGGALPAAEPLPVPSLEPAKTAELWSRLVSAPASRSRATAECRPLRAVFYAASDWLRLATKLAATASPCAEYYISVPPLVADKTTFRPNQAARIRALGPNFHTMAEIHFTTWNRWVTTTGTRAGTPPGSRHASGWRRRATTSPSATRGQLNELTTAVRRGDGNARANLREFLRGLYEGDGSRPTKGAVLDRRGRPADERRHRSIRRDAPELALRHGVLDGHGHVRQRLVAGGVRRRPQPRCSRRAADGPPRLPERLPPAQTRARGRRARRRSSPRARTCTRPTAHSGTPPGSATPATAGRWSPPSRWRRTSRHRSMHSATTARRRGSRVTTGASRGRRETPPGIPNARLRRRRRTSSSSGSRRRSATRATSSDPAEPRRAAPAGRPGQNSSAARPTRRRARHNEAWKHVQEPGRRRAIGFATPPQSIPAGAPSAAISALARHEHRCQPSRAGQRVAVTLQLELARRGRSPRARRARGYRRWRVTSSRHGTAATFYYQDTRAGSHDADGVGSRERRTAHRS